MNNDEQTTQPSTPEASDTEAADVDQNNSDMSNVEESTDNSDTSTADAGSVEAVSATDASDASTDGASDASTGDTGAADAGASDAGASDAGDADASDAGATEQVESPAEVLATEDRDEQDSQEPGEVSAPDENEAAPQAAEASETSQAEGEVETVDADLSEQSSASAAQPDATGEAAPEATPEPAAAPEPVAAQEATEAPQASEAPQAGSNARSNRSSNDDNDGDYEEPVIRTTPRLQDVAANASMEDLLRASEQQYRTLKHGDVIEGAIMKVGRDEIMVDIGAKTEGVIPSAELQSLTPEEREELQIGDTLLVSVVQPENNEGHAVLSLDRARQERSWRDLQKQYESGEVLQAKVTGYNKGGLLVNIEGVRGFIPSSQISLITGGGNDAAKQSEMAKMQNQMISLKIIEINRARNRLILSERQATQEQRESVRTRLLRELEPGQVRQGRVSSICDFGAFVDIGGADGLIHLSEISWKRVGHPSEVLKVGDTINVYVLSVDPNERKIALSLKRTQPEPWSTITENYKLGQIVRGTITQLTTFGAFARLDDGIEGLIHVSELAEGRVAHPKNVVNVGDQLDLKVIRIDPIKRRIGLSLKRVNEDENGEYTGDGGEGAVDSDTAANSSNGANVSGAFGEENEAPMGQVEVTEANSMESQQGDVASAATGSSAQAPTQATERAERPSRPERQDRGNRGNQGNQGNQGNRGNQNNDRQPAPAGDEAPLGALAQALGAFMSRDEEDEEES